MVVAFFSSKVALISFPNLPTWLGHGSDSVPLGSRNALLHCLGLGRPLSSNACAAGCGEVGLRKVTVNRSTEMGANICRTAHRSLKSIQKHLIRMFVCLCFFSLPRCVYRGKKLPCPATLETSCNGLKLPRLTQGSDMVEDPRSAVTVRVQAEAANDGA